MKALEEALEKREYKQISTDDLIELAKFVLQNNYFEFNEEVYDNFNKFHPNFRFSNEYSRKKYKFFDLDVKILDRKIVTDLHIKATDWHQNLHYTSFTPLPYKTVDSL